MHQDPTAEEEAVFAIIDQTLPTCTACYHFNGRNDNLIYCRSICKALELTKLVSRRIWKEFLTHHDIEIVSPFDFDLECGQYAPKTAPPQAESQPEPSIQNNPTPTTVPGCVAQDR